jgi:hypothetical protein
VLADSFRFPKPTNSNRENLSANGTEQIIVKQFVGQINMRTLIKLTIFLFVSTITHGQEAEIDRLIANELKMTFPSIYFKHNSTDFTKMPYSVDSCFKYIAHKFDKSVNSLVIWRDSDETEALTNKRTAKLKASLRKYMGDNNTEIQSTDNNQKVSRQTINMTSDKTKIQYLLSLNSVFDISKTCIPPKELQKKKSRRRLVWTGWKTGFHWSSAG